MGLFDLPIPEGSETPLTDVERESIDSAFAASQRPLHIVFRADIRYNKTTRKRSVCALSPHFIGLFAQKEPGAAFTCYEMFHISEVEMIAHKEHEFVLVKTKKTNLTVTGEPTTRFAQLLYRNYYITFSMNSPDDIVELRTDKLNLFPDITIHASPSQRFQFAYYAMCTANNLPYNHDVVRYIHNLILSRNSIVDVSQLPLELFANGKEEKKNDLVPIFHSLKLMRFVSGICAVNLLRPDVLKAFGKVLAKNNTLKIVHFANCGIEVGMEDLAEAVAKNENVSVVYWDLSYNKLSDMKYFARILENSTSPISLINLNYVTADADATAAIFNACARNENLWSLKYLYVAGLPMADEDVLDRFEGYLKARSKGKQPLEIFDVSSQVQSMDRVLQVLNRYTPPIRELCVRASRFDMDATNQLLIFIRESTTLDTLDLSGSNFSPEDVAGIINAIIQNENLTGFTLKLCSLQLNDVNLLPLFRAFLSSKASLAKWKSLAFDSNDMHTDDLKNLLPLFLRMRNLEELSFNYNFDMSMVGIDEQLARLLEINKIKKISLRGCEGHRLQEQLVILLRKIGKRPTIIESLDIAGNHIGDLSMAYLVHILHRSNTVLSTLNIDDNDFRNSDNIKRFVEAMEQNESLISFTFPLTDAQNIVESADKDERDIVIRTLSELQINAAERINVNRAKKKKPNDLPFPATEDIQQLISEISRDARHRLKSPELKRHTCVCQEFGLPLPFQRLGDVVTDGGDLDDNVDIGDMVIYETPSMGEYIIERNNMYPEFMYTTMQPDLRKVVNQEVPQIIPAPEPEKLRRSVKKSHKKHAHDSDDERGDKGHLRRSKKVQTVSREVQVSEDSESYESEDSRSKRKSKKVSVKHSRRSLKKSGKIDDSFSQDESSSDVEVREKRSSQKRKTKKQQISSESDDINQKRKTKKQQISSESEDSNQKKKTKKQLISSDSEDSDQKKKLQISSGSDDSDQKKKTKKQLISSESEDGSQKRKTKKQQISSDSEDSNQKKKTKKQLISSDSEDSNQKKKTKKLQISSESEDSNQKIEIRKKAEESSSTGSHAQIQKDVVKRSTKKLEFSTSEDEGAKKPRKKYTYDSSSESRPEKVIPSHQPMLSSSEGIDKQPPKKQKEASSGSDEELAEKRKKFQNKKLSGKFVLDSASSDSDRKRHEPAKERETFKSASQSKKKSRKYASDSDSDDMNLGTRLMNNDDIDKLMDTGFATYETRSRNLRDSGEFVGKPAPPLKLKQSTRNVEKDRVDPDPVPPPLPRSSMKQQPKAALRDSTSSDGELAPQKPISKRTDPEPKQVLDNSSDGELPIQKPRHREAPEPLQKPKPVLRDSSSDSQSPLRKPRTKHAEPEPKAEPVDPAPLNLDQEPVQGRRSSKKAIQPPPRQFLNESDSSDQNQDNSRNIFQSSSSSDGNFPIMQNHPVKKPPPQPTKFSFTSSSDEDVAPPKLDPERPTRQKHALAPSIGEALKRRQQEQPEGSVIPRPNTKPFFRPPPRRS